MEHFPQQPVIHREACDECHQRKVRCVTGNGACQNCILWGKSCIFSPRSSMGRPRKRKAVKSSSTSALHTSSSTGTGSFDSNVNSTGQQDVQASSGSSSTSHSSHFGIPTAADYLPTPPMQSDSGTDYLAHHALNQFSIQDLDFSVIPEADWCPIPEKNNSSNNSRPTAIMSSPEGRSPWDTITIFSTMLFDLRRQRDRLYSKDPSTTIFDPSSSHDTHEIFKQVSTFCEVTQRNFGGIEMSDGQDPLPETQSMMHLVIMTISTALDIYGLQVRIGDSAMRSPQYQQHLQHQMQPIDLTTTTTTADSHETHHHRHDSFSNHSNHSNATPSNTNHTNYWHPGTLLPHLNSTPHHPLPTPPYPTSTTSTINPPPPPRLPLILHLTTIDYHLAQFQWILSRLLLLFSPSSSASASTSPPATTHNSGSGGGGGAGRNLSQSPPRHGHGHGYVVDDDGPAQELKKSRIETGLLRERVGAMVEGLKSGA